MPSTSRHIATPLVLLVLCACDKETQPAPERAAPSVSATPSAAPVERVRFVHLPVEVGQKWRRKRSGQVKVSIEFFTETSRWATAESLREETFDVVDEIVARVGSWPGKVRATYEVHHLVESQSGKPNRDEHPLEGHTYLLDRVDTVPVATDVDGNKVEGELERYLWTHHSQIGNEDALISLLTQRPIPVGRKYPLKDVMFNALVGTEMGEYKEGNFTITKVAERQGLNVATFKWNAAVQTQEDNGMVMDWEIEGTADVALRPAYLMNQDIKGHIRVSGRTKKDTTWLRIEGAGSMKDHWEQAIVE